MLTDEQKKGNTFEPGSGKTSLIAFETAIFHVATQAFDDVDDTKSGTIPNTRQMLLEAAQLTGLNPTQREIDQTWNKESLTKEQFLDLVAGLEWKEPDEMKKQLRSDFEIFDPELTGLIEPGDLVHILSKEGRNKMDEGKAGEIVNAFEKDGNGQINIQQLIDRLLSPRPQIEMII